MNTLFAKIGVETGAFLKTMGRYGSAPGEFTGPTDVCVDSGRRLYVHHLSEVASRRAFVHVATTLMAVALPGSPAAFAAECSSIDSLPATIREASAVGLKVGRDQSAVGAGGAKVVLNSEPLLKDPAELSAALDACPADEKAKQEVLKALAAAREEIDYQVGKGVTDYRFPDPDDADDLSRALRKLGRTMDTAVKSAGRGASG